MIESRSLRVKSRIAVMKGSSLENKENVPYFSANKKGNVNTSTINKSTNRKTHAGNSGNLQSKQVVKTQKVKSAPNFEKLHWKWESTLAKRKAITKRTNTKFEPFNLTNTPKKNEDVNLNDEFLDDCEGKSTNCDNEDVVSPKRSSNETCADSSQDNFKDRRIRSNAIGKTPTVSKSGSHRYNLSSVREKGEQNDQDLFDFEPDNAALESILNNVGVVESNTQVTPSIRSTSTLCSPSPFKQKRFSVYYTGPHPDRPLSGFGQRLMSRRASAMNEVRKSQIIPTTSRKQFEPSRTLVGIQEMGSRFAVTPQKELTASTDCTKYKACPSMSIHDEETSYDNTLPCAEPSNIATGRFNGTNLNEVSWADTLQYYSQFSSNTRPTPKSCDKPQDAETLMAQLEDEVYRNISEVKLGDENVNSQRPQPITPYSCTCVTNSVFGRTSNLPHSNCSYPLQVSREKTPLFRQLFASPSSSALENRETMDNYETMGFETKTTFTKNMQKNPCETRLAQKEPFEIKPTIYEFGSVPLGTLQEHDTLKNVVSPPASSVPSFSSFSGDVQRSYKPHNRPNCPPVSVLAVKSSVYEGKSTADPFSFAQTIYGKGSDVPSTPLETHFKSQSISASSRQHVNELSAFNAVRSFKTRTKGMLSINGDSVTSDREDSGTKVIVPTAQRPVTSKALSGKLNSQEAGMSGFFTRHCQIMRDAFVKSREYAQEILLDAEVSLYARNIEHLQKHGVNQRLENPLAKLFIEGDDMHFAPVCE